MEEKRKAKSRRRPPPLPPMPRPMSDSVLSFFLDSPSSSTSSSKNSSSRLRKAVSAEEPVTNDQRRTSVRSGVMLDSTRRYAPSVALSRSDGDPFLSSKSSTSSSRLVPRSTSSTTSLKSSRCKKRPRGLANHLGGFLLHSVTPRESSILQYTSIVSPGTHTEYDLVLEDSMVSGVGETWVVSRRYSGFRSLRDELARVFDRRNHPEAAVDSTHAHCSHCAPMNEALDKLSAKYFPKRRLWGSKSPKVVQQRAEQFFKYLQGLLALATNPSTRRCPLVALGFAVQLRTFLTLEREPYRGVPGAFRGGAVPFLLNEMTLLEARPDNATTLMTIDELDGGYADSTDEEYDIRHHDDNSHTSSASDLPSPVYVLEEQDEIRSWDELDQWEEISVASSEWGAGKH
ncbi:hypothetical protein PF010_g3131 [Phytophthora fragariae]|uniref:PX domain-containing protein n=1 Tax=Phytophthora fragariae TaxID=53985 RepID=A0A6A3LXG9_9STRA|nr:hypothetical protein PF011_g3786 [Phytophthora fragariae]KAE9132575.1 hypothetical protein PF010_g3131 [Phytophthora fragariae]KAE9238955.1 hypothetical protein PF004_g8170 [Phytophthora fragariae]KAE9304977.1 hypothetical protein PF008_g21841 [Phytophthora fragariae]